MKISSNDFKSRPVQNLSDRVLDRREKNFWSHMFEQNHIGAQAPASVPQSSEDFLKIRLAMQK